VAKAPELRVGTSGYQYDHWKGIFYPADLPKSRWFEHYARVFDTLEINNTFYRLPEPHVFDAWRQQAPPGFRYAVKFSRYGSHLKRLKDPERSVGRFWAAARRLRRTLGPVLVQLPPRWPADPDRLAAFLAALPRGQRWAFEFRDPRWLVPAVFELLRRRRAALCIHDKLEHPPEVTADWVYVRFHGGEEDGSYSGAQLSAWSRRIADWLRRDYAVFAYFNTDIGGYAVRNALELKRLLSSRLR
jgi:uncharacterized protein YecE (DUF72 family)